MENNKNLNDSSTNEQKASLKDVKADYQNWRQSTSKWLSDLLDIREKTDKPTTITHIKEDIPFKGHTAWILICAVFIASIGLNANSTAVVIGAMLISPLMGPILGMGMAVAINDIDTLRRSVINFTVMVVISVLTAFLFFLISPIKAESTELIARTAPDFRDVMIAFFGGLALIIARTKEGTIASVIFGVAIATALMPPLCTAGFGLAIGNLNYFFGAMYLFSINTIFIALATYLILKLLRFPMVKYANQKARKRTTRIVTGVAILAMVPAIVTFYNVFQKQVFMSQAQSFVQKEIAKTQFEGKTNFLEKLTSYEYHPGEKESVINVVFLGEEVPKVLRNTWSNKLHDYNGLHNTRIEITDPNRNENVENYNYVTELYEKVKEESQDKNAIIANLKEELDQAKSQIRKTIPFRDIINKAYVNYPDIESISYYQKFVSDTINQVDSTYVLELDWSEDIDEPKKTELKDRFQKWIELEIPNEKVSLR